MERELGSRATRSRDVVDRREQAGLRAYLDRHHTPDEKLLVCGDFNVAPDERDVHDPNVWSRSTLFHQTSRDALAHIPDFGLVDI